MKKFSLFLAGILALSVLASCAHLQKVPSSGTPSGSGSTAAPAGLTYNGQDISKPVELVLYFIGDVSPDQDKVLAEINTILKEKVNATLVTKSISLSDYTTKYALTIAGGGDIDMIYTSTWAFYQSEANKGAFIEVTPEIRKKFMPLHGEFQAEASWGQAEIGGKVFFVPCNAANVNANALVLRGDLREKYKLPRLSSIDDLSAYYTAVAADKDSGVNFAYNASQNNDMSKTIMYLAGNNFVQMAGTLQNYFTYKYSADVSSSDVFWIYSSPEYLAYAKQMKAWANNGYWSKSAIANATDVKEAFLNGTSASYTQNLGTVGATASQMMADHPEWKPEVYDLTPDADRFLATYTGDGIAIVGTSKNQERAFMALDVLKFDEDAYNLLRHGIDGVHYEKVGDKMWKAGPDAANWQFGNALSWGFKNNKYNRSREDTFPDQSVIGNIWTNRAIEGPTAAFSFDDSKVQNELANLQSVYTQYVPLLDLGLVADVESTIAEFQAKAESAGLAKIQAEVEAQLKEFLGK